VVLIIAVPAETLLLRALATPDPQVAAREWVAGLSTTSLRDASNQVQQYPFVYRKEIMRALTPSARARVWSAHLGAYLRNHPALDETAANAIRAAMSMATAEAFGNTPSAALRESVGAVAQQIEDLLGREEARLLMYRLGPVDGSFASAEPLSHKLTNYIRHLAVVMAGKAPDCDCNQGFGCDSTDSHCSGATACDPDTEWPSCGWFWNEDCDGMCMNGRETVAN
jgi:hypothetical protein